MSLLDRVNLPITEPFRRHEGSAPAPKIILGEIRDVLTSKSDLVFYASVDGDLIVWDALRNEAWALDIFSLLMNYQNQREEMAPK